MQCTPSCGGAFFTLCQVARRSRVILGVRLQWPPASHKARFMFQRRANAFFIATVFCFGCAPAPTVSGRPESRTQSEGSEVSVPTVINIMPLKISSVLNVSDVQINEAHGTSPGNKMWWLLAANQKAYIHVDGTDSNDLTRISIYVPQQTAGNGIESDLAIIRTIVAQIFPEDPWFSGDSIFGSGTDQKLPFSTEHNEFWVTLDVVKGSTELTITPAADHRIAANTESPHRGVVESTGKNKGEPAHAAELR